MPTTEIKETELSTPPELVAVTQGKVFLRSPVLQKLLLYLWEHHEREISEYAIAVEALGRDTSFDPAIDATVRVTIGRLRGKLRDHYLESGTEGGVRYEIPLGSHRLVQVNSPAPVVVPEMSAEAPPAMPMPPARARLGWMEAGSLGLAAVLLVVVLILVARVRADSRQQGQAHELLRLQPWSSLAANGKPLRIIVPTPVFFSWKNENVPSQNQRFLVRDVAVNSFDDIAKSQELSRLTAEHGKPLLGQTYTVISDTFASISLARFLDRNGLGDRAEVFDRAGATLSAVQHDNVIALGTSATLAPFARELSSMDFALETGDERLINRRPDRGELPFLDFEVEATDRAKWPGIIAVLPGVSPDTVEILLVGRFTSALATFLTSRDGLNDLEAAREKAGNPKYFEAAISSEMSADRLVSQKLVMFHAHP